MNVIKFVVILVDLTRADADLAMSSTEMEDVAMVAN